MREPDEQTRAEGPPVCQHPAGSEGGPGAHRPASSTAAAAVPVVVRRALLPLERITMVAQTISAGGRERRLRPTRPETELGRTAVAFDVMLDDITGAEQRATDSEARLGEFLFDAAHELRTPLTGVQAAAERVLRDDPDKEQREQVLMSVVREAQRAGRLVEDMLLMRGSTRVRAWTVSGST